MAGRAISNSTRRALQTILPRIDFNANWSLQPEKNPDESVRDFKIKVSGEVLEDLKTRLKNTRTFTKSLQGTQQQYGLNSNTLKPYLDFWEKKYDWNQREKHLNSLPQYQTEIQGLKIHFIRSKPNNSQLKTLPILMLHGWPSTSAEFLKSIPLLTKGKENHNFAFEVVAPSLPGFGYSEAAGKPGLGAIEMGVLFRELMKRLGFEEYYVHGGDWGGLIVRHIATLFPQHVLGLHSNFCFARAWTTYWKYLVGRFYPKSQFPENVRKRIYPLKMAMEGLVEESGYFHIQATKPDTIGFALTDSPAGLAAYILEKYAIFTSQDYKYAEDGGLSKKFTHEELLDNITIFWLTNSITTSMRIYAESFTRNQMNLNMREIPIDKSVPCAIARFPHEIFLQPDFMLKDKYQNIVQSTDFDRGGHFAPLEEPQLLADDIYSAVNKMEILRK